MMSDLLNVRVLSDHFEEQSMDISILLQCTIRQMNISIHKLHHAAVQQSTMVLTI